MQEEEDFLMKLSEEQEAIVCYRGSLAVIAGAGCGKTTTLVAKCLAFLEERPKARCVAISFTERSARDIRRKTHHEQIVVGTIHGFCASLLREAGISRTILDQSDRFWRELAYDIFTTSHPIGRTVDEILERETPDSLLILLARLRDLDGLGVFDEPGERTPFFEKLWSVYAWLDARWVKWKEKRNSMDFQDIESFLLMMLEDAVFRKRVQERFDLIVVDEFQDTNARQVRIIERIVRDENLCICGDPKQSI